MKPTLATSYLMLACHFLSGALRARRIGGEGLSRLRAANARACFQDWQYHSRKAGAFTPDTQEVQRAELEALARRLLSSPHAPLKGPRSHPQGPRHANCGSTGSPAALWDDKPEHSLEAWDEASPSLHQ